MDYYNNFSHLGNNGANSEYHLNYAHYLADKGNNFSQNLPKNNFSALNQPNKKNTYSP